mgnify:CR=1 FL=1
MVRSLLHKLILFFVPGAVLLSFGFFFVEDHRFYAWVPLTARLVSITAPIAGIIVGWRFQRSRLVFGVIILAICNWLVHEFPFHGYGATPEGRYVFNLLGILLPLDFFLLALINERGLISRYGIARLILIAVQPVVFYAVYKIDPALGSWLEKPLFPDFALDNLFISQSVLFSFCVFLICIGIYYLLEQDLFIGGLFWGLVSVFTGLGLYGAGPKVSLFLGIAQIMLLVAVLESAYFLAYRDELTGLPSRRSLNEYSMKMGRKYAISMLDIDFFKKFNDRYGHDVGDQVLCMVAARLSEVTCGGKAFRYGGEEFTIVFPNKTAEEVLPEVEKLRKTIQTAGFTMRSKTRPVRKKNKARNKSADKAETQGRKTVTSYKVTVTVSAGIADRADNRKSFEDVLKAADKSLYTAKKQGRNKVCLFS